METKCRCSSSEIHEFPIAAKWRCSFYRVLLDGWIVLTYIGYILSYLIKLDEAQSWWIEKCATPKIVKKVWIGQKCFVIIHNWDDGQINIAEKSTWHQCTNAVLAVRSVPNKYDVTDFSVWRASRTVCHVRKSSLPTFVSSNPLFTIARVGKHSNTNC